eukprot:TRINITY_DN4456_c0_g1_i1.p1 TRINITY_DN4456_c0_g1~~TRINITY_DN4456_c0_g1_i1.p1  ORF type:complete len:605 (-),score=121.14 TRINITY_DN4456_c0_g1_i1:127-1941(-)
MSAFATVVTLDSFVDGVIALAHSLHSVSPQYPFVILYTPTTLSAQSIHRLQTKTGGASQLISVQPVPNPNAPNNNDNSHWFTDSSFTKLRLWTLDQIGFDKIVYLDPDTVVVRNIDHLFQLVTKDRYFLAAAPDIFPPDKFNAGVLVLSPNSHLFVEMLRVCSKFESYDGGDTGFLNQFFSRWYNDSESWFDGFDECHLKHRQLVQTAKLQFGYNAQRIMHSWTHKKRPLYWENAVNVHVLHYSSSPKPWERPLHNDSGDLDRLWWQFFNLDMSCGSEHRHDMLELPIPSPSESSGLFSPLEEFHGSRAISSLKKDLWSSDGSQSLSCWMRLYDELFDQKLEAEDPIPKLLHFIWFGDQVIPDEFLCCVRAWEQEVAADWTVKLWGDGDVERLPLLRNDIDLTKLSPVQKSDIMRLEILNSYGGVYLDCDMFCIPKASGKNLAEICSSVSCFFGFSNTGVVEVNNGAMGSTRGHPVIKTLLDSLDMSVTQTGNAASRVIKTTGPGFLTKNLSLIPVKTFREHKTVILPAHVFYPLPNVMKGLKSFEDHAHLVTRKTVAVHRWACSWQKKQNEADGNPKVKNEKPLDKLSAESEALKRISSFLGL